LYQVMRQRSSTCRLPRDSYQEDAVRKRQQCVLRGLKEIDELPGYDGGDTLNDRFDSFHRAPPLKLNRIAVLRKHLHLGSHEPNTHECSAWKSFPQRKEKIGYGKSKIERWQGFIIRDTIGRAPLTIGENNPRETGALSSRTASEGQEIDGGAGRSRLQQAPQGLRKV
jgi:hypothetical protein